MAEAKQSPKLKPLMPSLREKKRYIRFEMLSSEPIEQDDAFRAIWDSALALHGEAGLAKAGLWILPDKYDLKNQRGILRVAHHSVDDIKASLAMMTKIKKTPVIVQATKVSGMINKV